MHQDIDSSQVVEHSKKGCIPTECSLKGYVPRERYPILKTLPPGRSPKGYSLTVVILHGQLRHIPRFRIATVQLQMIRYEVIVIVQLKAHTAAKILLFVWILYKNHLSKGLGLFS